MKSQANRLWQLRNAGAGMVCGRQRGNGLCKTLGGGCTIEGTLNFEANTGVSLLCSIAGGMIQIFLSLFNLESPAMQIGENVFICSGQCTGPKEFAEHRTSCCSCSRGFAGPAEQPVVWAVLTAASVCFENLSSHVSGKCNALPGSSKLKVRKVPCGQQ